MESVFKRNFRSFYKANQNNIVVWFFRILFLCISIYQLSVYLDYGKVFESANPIEYTYVDKQIHSGGRGSHYSMKVLYNRKKYTLAITSTLYDAIDKNEFPDLYYSKKNDAVFSLWGRKRAFRIMLVSTFMFLISFIPLNKLIQKIPAPQAKK